MGAPAPEIILGRLVVRDRHTVRISAADMVAFADGGELLTPLTLALGPPDDALCPGTERRDLGLRDIDLADHIKTELDAELLKRTPAAFLGSCRYKLPEIHENREVYDKIFSILDKLDIEAFIYIGGNDSMDTIKKLSDYAIITGHPTRFIGCPKTIDNDLALTDHTPGYGSAAKYIGTSMKEIIRDGFCLEYEKGIVTIVEIMGRNAGWLTGATALSEGEDCEGPDLIYLPEVTFDLKKFCE